MNLYEVAAEYAQLDSLISELEGAPGEEIDESLQAAFQQAQGTMKQKVDSVLKLIRNADADADSAGVEAARFKKRSSVARNKADRLRSLLKRVMTHGNIANIKTDNFTVSSYQTPSPRVEYHIEKMPKHYLKQVWVIDPEHKEEARSEAILVEPEWANVVRSTSLRIS